MQTVPKSPLGRVLSIVADKPGCVQFHRPAVWRDIDAARAWARRTRPDDISELGKYYERIRNETNST